MQSISLMQFHNLYRSHIISILNSWANETQEALHQSCNIIIYHICLNTQWISLIKSVVWYWWCHNTNEKQTASFVSKKWSNANFWIKTNLKVKTFETKHLSWFVMLYHFRQTHCVFYPLTKLGDRKHNTGWIKYYLPLQIKVDIVV